jgi:Rrf2 family protein
VHLQKSTRYALCAAMELAGAGPGSTVTASAVAERYDIPASVVAKVFQQLVRSGIAIGTRGQRGGYALARSPREITLIEVIDTFEPPAAGRLGVGRLQGVLDEVNDVVRTTFASITLETLAGPGRGRASVVPVGGSRTPHRSG